MESPFVHAISGCDTVSRFSGVGTKAVWQVWRSMLHLDPLFYHLSHAPLTVTEADVEAIERFVVMLYKRTSPLQKVNEARKYLFAFYNRQLENIPPSRAALIHYTSKGLSTKQVMYGDKHSSPIHLFHLLQNGDGRRQTMDGPHIGQHSRKHLKSAVNL